VKYKVDYQYQLYLVYIKGMKMKVAKYSKIAEAGQFVCQKNSDFPIMNYLSSEWVIQ